MNAMRHPEPWGLDRFLEWEDAQDEKHELVDGFPVLRRLRLMAGGTPEHALIAMNIGIALHPKLRGGSCRPFGSDLRVLTPRGNLRYPDVTVLCRPLRRGEKAVQDPSVVFEVLSPSNSPFQLNTLVRDYQSIPGLAHIVLVSQESALAQVWSRVEGGWDLAEVRGLEASLDLPALGVATPLGPFYEGVELRPEADATEA